MKLERGAVVVVLGCSLAHVTAFGQSKTTLERRNPPISARMTTMKAKSSTKSTSDSQHQPACTPLLGQRDQGGYVPSGLTHEEYQAIRAQDRQQHADQKNLGAWGPRFSKGQAPLGDWMVDPLLWTHGFGVEEEEDVGQEDNPFGHVRSRTFASPPGRLDSAVSVQEAQEWLEYHADWFVAGDDEGNEKRRVEVSVVDFTGRTWDVDALAVLESNLTMIAAEVKVLRLAKTTIRSSPGSKARVMEMWSNILASSTSSLQEIDLSDNDLSNTATAQHVGTLLGKSPQLERLYMVNCSVQEDSPILNGFLQSLQSTTFSQLKELVMDENPDAGPQLAQDVAMLLTKCPNLQVLSYCGNSPEMEGTQAFVDALKVMIHPNSSPTRKCGYHPLTILRLENFAFDTDNGSSMLGSLASALASTLNLQHLSLRHSAQNKNIDKNASRQLMKALVHSKCPLEHLELVGCNLQLGGAVDLVQGLFAQTALSLKVLKADLHELVELHNDEFGEGGIRHMLAPFENESAVLQELELEQVSEQCIRDLLYSQLPRHCLERLTLFFNDVAQQDLELSDIIDWKRRLSIKYPSAKVFLYDTQRR